MILNMIRGFCMALVDSVPGVSGSTIALLLGFYDKFINSLDHLVSGSKEERKEAVQFLIKLGIGWVMGFIVAVLILTRYFDDYIYQISSLFIGFIVFVIPIIIMDEKEYLKGKYIYMMYTIIGITVVFLVTYFAGDSILGKGVDITAGSLDLKMCLYLFVAAVVAISAMVLPGISGSTLLLIFGLYVPMISAIKECLYFRFEYFPAVIIFGVGIITGALTFVKVVKAGLRKYRSQMLYFIIGLMIGSLYAIIKGPETLEIPQEAMGFSNFHVVFFVISGVLIFGMQWMKKRSEGS